MIKPLLQAAIKALVTREHPGHMLVGDEATAWLTGTGLGYGKVATATGDVTGFGPEGMAAVAALVKAIRDPSEAFQRGASFTTFAAAVADQLIAVWRADSKQAVDDAMVQRFEADFATWWNAVTGPRRHFIPCAILSYVANDVVVGPVTFVHASRIVGHPRGLPRDHALTEMACENIGRALAERSAAWIAVVEVDGCHPSRSTEIADLAVDVAITGLAFLTVGLPIDRDALVAEAGLDVLVGSGTTLGVAYTGQVGDRAQDHAVKGNFTYRFRADHNRRRHGIRRHIPVVVARRHSSFGPD